MDKEQHDLRRTARKYEHALREVEQGILDAIASKDAVAILESPVVHSMLAQAHEAAMDLKVRLDKVHAMQDRIATVRNRYREGIAEHAAVFYFAIVDLANINYAYQFSLSWYCDVSGPPCPALPCPVLSCPPPLPPWPLHRSQSSLPPTLPPSLSHLSPIVFCTPPAPAPRLSTPLTAVHQIYARCLWNCPKPSNAEERQKAMLSYFIQELYFGTCRSLFEQDKLPFAVTMALRYMLHSGTARNAEVNMLVHGTVKDPMASLQKQLALKSSLAGSGPDGLVTDSSSRG